jgi:hypothetical protein
MQIRELDGRMNVGAGSAAGGLDGIRHPEGGGQSERRVGFVYRFRR